MAYTEFRTGVIKPVEVFREAWEMIKGQYWLILGITIVGMLVGGAVPIVLLGPMMCGIYLVLFARHEGRAIDFSQLFKGFDYFMPSLIVALIIMVPTLFLIFVIYIPLIIVPIMGGRLSESELFALLGTTVAVDLVIAVVMVCIHTLMLFSFPLIVDKRMSAFDSIKTSARAVWANLSGVVGLFAVGFLVCFVGYLALCVGIYLVMPLIIAANVVAYRKIFPGTVDVGLQ